MDKLVVGLGALSVMALFLMVWPLLGTLFGTLSGWVVGLFFSETILGFFAALGVTSLKMWQIGASLGFIGGFLRNTQINKQTNKKS